MPARPLVAAPVATMTAPELPADAAPVDRLRRPLDAPVDVTGAVWSVTEPDPNDELVPLMTVTPPPMFDVLAPADNISIPPAAPVADVWPAVTITPPPLPTVELPTDNNMEPAEPVPAEPVDSWILPELTPLPVNTRMFPDAAVARSTVKILTPSSPSRMIVPSSASTWTSFADVETFIPCADVTSMGSPPAEITP